ncbi:MAG: P pilus assembly/Cpx signaling pathway, periplasmic inhibitor/zinc-resistance associated protein [Scytonema sp. PMC 1069.18]|nr:P pilus assembly/Cpx signaling pathway, periplasmic inhibitor/zinc-resistance associated protein [Scytonema sp. PMC 1069.18]MEC4882369.1 P pilus assembly/Cpx signaling pathway, periplasmic inhibitor/zinc-resistance associated protein [Scytonema sp. PMC 1070.18]
MKLRSLSIIAGAIALTLTATSLAVKAEPITSSPTVVAQQMRQKGKGMWQQLGLTEAQQEQIKIIRQNTRAEMDKILTDEQRAQLKTSMQNGGVQNRRNRRGGFASLNLTDAQQTQMRQLMESQKTQIEAVLTPAQKAQLEQMKQERRSRHQNRGQQ